jgi:hypothetical protein
MGGDSKAKPFKMTFAVASEIDIKLRLFESCESYKVFLCEPPILV